MIRAAKIPPPSMNESISFMDKQPESGTSPNRLSGKRLKSATMQKYAGLPNRRCFPVCRFGGLSIVLRHRRRVSIAILEEQRPRTGYHTVGFEDTGNIQQ